MQTTLIRNSINFKVFVFHTRYFSIPKLHLVLFLFSHKTFYCISCERGGTSKTWQFISNLLIFTSFAEHNWKLEVEAVAKPYIFPNFRWAHTKYSKTRHLQIWYTKYSVRWMFHSPAPSRANNFISPLSAWCWPLWKLFIWKIFATKPGPGQRE